MNAHQWCDWVYVYVYIPHSLYTYPSNIHIYLWIKPYLPRIQLMACYKPALRYNSDLMHRTLPPFFHVSRSWRVLAQVTWHQRLQDSKMPRIFWPLMDMNFRTGAGNWIIQWNGYGSIPIKPFLGGWTSIYQLFWCSPGVQGFDTLPNKSTEKCFV